MLSLAYHRNVLNFFRASIQISEKSIWQVFGLGEILKDYICKLVFTPKYRVNTPKTLHLKFRAL